MPYSFRFACLLAFFSADASAAGTTVWEMDSPAGLPAIVLPESPSVTEKFAAAELQRYSEWITGKRMPIVHENEMLPEKTFRVGQTRCAAPFSDRFNHPVPTLRRETMLLQPGAHRLHLLGGADRGTLYAVYAFLELQGCRWIEPGPDGEIIPRRDRLLLPDNSVLQHPEFAVREIGRGASSPEEAEQVIDWSVKNRQNRNFNLRMHPAWEKRGGQVLWQHICHNTPWLLPNDPWFESHPQYFSLFNGRRIPQDKEGGYLCTTHPGVRQRVADFIVDWFDRNPEGDAVPVSPPDGDVKWCECPDCLAQGGVNFDPGPDGHMTRRQVDFINAVARKVAVHHPDRYIVNLAYSRYVWPYEGLQTEPNVINQIAHGYAGNGSLVHAIDTDWNREARDIFHTWALSGGGGIGIWDYFILHVPDQSGSPLTPLGFGRVADRMVDFLKAFPNPYKVYFTQAGDALHRHNAFLYYALSRKIWDPSQSFESIRKDYAETLFGVAAGEAVAYLELLDQAYASANWNPPIWREITVPSAQVFTPEVLEEGFRLLHRMRDLLEDTGSPLALDMLERMVQSLTYAETTVLPKQLVGSDDGILRLVRGADGYTFNPGAPEGHELNWKRIRDLAVDGGFLDASMERVLFRTRSRLEPMVWLENDRLRLGVLPGVGGRLIRLHDLRQEQENLFYEPMQLLSLHDPGATYFRYGGYEEYTRRDFASPGWELKMEAGRIDTETGSELRLRALTAEQVLLERQIVLKNGDSPDLWVRTVLTNRGTNPFPAMIRVHPEFQLSEDLSTTALVWQGPSGEPMLRPASALAAADELHPTGWWGLICLQTGRGILNHFTPGEATTHVHLDRIYQTVNLELFGTPATLAPGESVALTHRYQVIAHPGELPGGLRALWEEAARQEINPLEGLEPAMGPQEEPAVRLTATGTPRFASLHPVLNREGSFSVWFALDGKASEQHDALIFSAGARQPDYMVLAVREGKLVFYRTQRHSGPERAYNAWVKVEAELEDTKPGTWQHVAVNWSRRDAEFSEVEFFVNGRRMMRRNDLEMRSFLQPMFLALGWDSSNAARPRFPGRIANLSVFPRPLTSEEVLALYRDPGLKTDHAVLQPDFGNLAP